jgi:hypothetical protein
LFKVPLAEEYLHTTSTSPFLFSMKGKSYGSLMASGGKRKEEEEEEEKKCW